MPKFTIKVSDTVTYKRVFSILVEARTKAEAEEKALNEAIVGDVLECAVEEEQIDNTPWEVVS